MRDPKQLLTLLREMASTADGRIRLVRVFGMSENDIRKIHHMEMLVDAQHAEWPPNQFPRITSAGYDFIEAVDKNPSIMEKFLELSGKGMPYFRAAQAVIEATAKLLAPA